MYKAKQHITTSSLQNFLRELVVNNTSLGFRYRLLGEMWKPNFMRVVKITKQGAIFTDEQTQEFVFLADVADVVQFEIDNRHKEFEPHFHYEVSPE